MNTAKSQVKRISPMLAVADMTVTLDFYTSILGFVVAMKSPGYSIVERDGASIHLLKAENEEVMKAVRGRTEIYIEVADITPLWDHVRQFKTHFRIRDLCDREYGMREFHISDPNECLVFVGQRIA